MTPPVISSDSQTKCVQNIRYVLALEHEQNGDTFLHRGNLASLEGLLLVNWKLCLQTLHI